MASELKGERLEKELARLEAMKAYEKGYEDYTLICGIDEAGRGPLAGPVQKRGGKSFFLRLRKRLYPGA